jgi:hypothetical protein
MTKKELNELQRTWYTKLREEGFRDIERYALYTTKTSQLPKIMLNHSRRPNESTTEVFGRLEETGEWIRVIGIYAHHNPDLSDDLREILITISDTGNISYACGYDELKRQMITRYFRANKAKMLKFVNGLTESDRAEY